MTYSGSPQGSPNVHPSPSQQPPAYSPATSFGEQPPQYDRLAPPQPVHDQGTWQQAANGEGVYHLDPLVSAPTHQPAAPNLGQPMSGPPTAYGLISGPPTSGLPSQPTEYPVTGPPNKRGVAVPLLATFLALVVIVAGVFVGLWVDKSNTLATTESTSNQRQVALDQSDKDLEQTRTDLKAKAAELAKAQQDLRAGEAEKTEFKRQRDVMGTCLKLLIEALDAINDGDKTTADKKVNEMKQPCNEAQAILGI